MGSPHCRASTARFATVAGLLIATPTLLAQATIERPTEHPHPSGPRGGDLILINEDLTIDGLTDPPLSISGDLMIGWDGIDTGQGNNYGWGTLRLINGGQFTANAARIALSDIGHYASVEVSGPGSHLETTQGFLTGDASHSDVLVEGGATARIGGDMYVNSFYFPNAHFDITGPGSRVDIGGTMTLGGFRGRGWLSVVDGAELAAAGNLWMGAGSSSDGSRGDARISGPDSSIEIGGDLILGGDEFGTFNAVGSGKFVVSNGATASVGGSVQLYSTLGGGSVNFTSSLLVNDEGSSLDIGGDVKLVNGGESSVGMGAYDGASLRIRGDTEIGAIGVSMVPSVRSAAISSRGLGSSILFDGDVDVAGTRISFDFFSGLIATDGGVIQAGSVTIIEDDGVLTLELSEFTRQDAGEVPLTVLGHFEAAGTFRLEIAEDYEPAPGQVFDLIDFGSVAGAFSEVVLPEDAPGLDLSQLLVDGTIRVLAPCNEADFSEPYEQFDIDDVILFLILWNTTDPAADLAPPMGVYDFDDVLAFLTAFAAGCP